MQKKTFKPSLKDGKKADQSTKAFDLIKKSRKDPSILKGVIKEHLQNEIKQFIELKTKSIDFTLSRCLIYGTQKHKTLAKQLNESMPASVGVCAKEIQDGDVAWHCEDCEKDPTCVMCKECFENSNHEGHRVWLDTNVEGFCDCGDHDGFDQQGFCSEHQGFGGDGQLQEMLSCLPQGFQERATEVFSQICMVLKELILQVCHDLPTQENKKQSQTLIGMFYQDLQQYLDECSVNAHFISRALIDTYAEESIKIPQAEKQEQKHECCYKYFATEQNRSDFNELMLPNDTCTCSVLDLILQLDKFMDASGMKKTAKLFFTLFKNYELKKNLGISYISNLEHLFSPLYSSPTHFDDGVTCFGVQLLTIEEVQLIVLKDKTLRHNLTKVMLKTQEQLDLQPLSHASRDHIYRTTIFLFSNVSYLLRPKNMQIIVKQTDLLEQLLHVCSKFYFYDLVTQVETHQDVPNAELISALCHSERQYLPVIKTILQYVEDLEDQQRIFKCFATLFSELQSRQPQIQFGLFSAPLHRLFATFLSRIIGKNMLFCSSMRNIAQDFIEKYMPSKERADLFTYLMTSHSQQQGFIAEIKSKKWVFRGEVMQLLVKQEHKEYETCFLPQIALFQLIIISQGSQALNQFLDNFGTDNWLKILFQNIECEVYEGGSAINSIKEESFSNLPNFDVCKLSLQLQQLLIKLIHICIYETPVLSQCISKADKEKGNQELESLFKNAVDRHIFHILFMQGASTRVDKIVKNSEQIYVKADQFQESILKMTTTQIDAQGKKKYRLKDDLGLLSVFDPYFYYKEKHQSAYAESYNTLHANKEGLNNIIGDYQDNYKYQTFIPKACRKAIAFSQKTAILVARILRLAIDVYMNSQNMRTTPVSAFEQQLFPRKILYMSLKISFWVLNENKNDTVGVYQELLTKEYMDQLRKFSNDKKLNQIFQDFSDLIYGSQTLKTEEKEEKKTVQLDSEAKKELLKQKKADILAKMQQKRKNILQTKCQTEQVQIQPESQQSIHCASCQEVIEIDQFNQRPFMQLGLATSTKLLHHSFRQTIQSQKQSLQNQKNFHIMTEEQKDLRDENLTENFDINDILSTKKTGVTLQKCCHFFHKDCLATYIRTTNQQNEDDEDFKLIIGIEESEIQCPICKGLNNVYIPYFPLEVLPSVEKMSSHWGFLKKLQMVHNQSDENQIEDSLSDIFKQPVKFCEDIQNIIAHNLLLQGTIKQSLFKQFNHSEFQDDMTLRDVIYILKSIRTIFKFLFDEQKIPFSPKEIGQKMLAKLVAASDIHGGQIVVPYSELEFGCLVEDASKNPFQRNWSKVAVQILFCISLMIPYENIDKDGVQKCIKVVVNSIYTAFKAQVFLSLGFKESFGQLDQEKVTESFFQQQLKEKDNEEIIQSQLSFLRIVSAATLCVQALAEPRTFDTHLGLNTEFMTQVRNQSSDTAEFILLTKFLDLDIKHENLFKRPVDLVSSSILTEQTVGSLAKICSLKTDTHSALIEFKQTFTCMPNVLLLLTPYYTFNLISLPTDFIKFQLEYYRKKCKNCNKEVAINAICLICGDAVCLERKDDCCTQLEGMHQLMITNEDEVTDYVYEGELSYHARMCEGGAAIFIAPSTAEVFLVDEGRSTTKESFYRNKLGESYFSHKERYYEYVEFSEATGGLQAYDQLKKAYVGNKITNLIVNERAEAEGVIQRYLV